MQSLVPRRRAMTDIGRRTGERLAFCAASRSTHRTQTEPYVPVPAGADLGRAPLGVSLAQDASERAQANRVMSPISASSISAVNGPTPGNSGEDLDPGRAWRAGGPRRGIAHPGCRRA